ncbi:MAG: 50S ribosomal protein L6 [Phycisphaerales bacterium]|jgi:large subunit ribosomal protein L6|nr:50S ribosomal protein L6 [Phycisphaerales bacterium]
MSRIGKKPVSVPGNVKVSVASSGVTIEGPKGSLTMKPRPEVKIAWNQDEKSLAVTIDEKDSDNRFVRAYWGLTRAMLANMVKGVTEGYTKSLEIVGVGWGAQLAGKQLKLQLGFAAPVLVDIPESVKVSVDKQIVKIEGADKQAVGQFAAVVRSKRKPEPYNGKGVKYTDEVIRRKEGKKFGA